MHTLTIISVIKKIASVIQPVYELLHANNFVFRRKKKSHGSYGIMELLQ